MASSDCAHAVCPATCTHHMGIEGNWHQAQALPWQYAKVEQLCGRGEARAARARRSSTGASRCWPCRIPNPPGRPQHARTVRKICLSRPAKPPLTHLAHPTHCPFPSFLRSFLRSRRHVLASSEDKGHRPAAPCLRGSARRAPLRHHRRSFVACRPRGRPVRQSHSTNVLTPIN